MDVVRIPWEPIAATITVCVALASPTLARAPTSFGFTPVGGPFRSPDVAGLSAFDPAACAGCHADVAREWEGSMHARSFRDPIFRAELRDAPADASCLGCHSPLDPERTGGARADVGVACGACHVREGTIFTAHSPRGPVPHPLRVVADFGSARFCAGCHEFDFPDFGPSDELRYDPASRQQATLREWQETSHARAGRDCVSCHMERVDRGGGRRGTSHGLRSLEDASFVADAISVGVRTDARDAGRLGIELTLAVRGAGHAVPSGDIFRELRVRVENACGSDERILRRNFAETLTARGWMLGDVYDDRVLPGEPKAIRLGLPRCEGPARYSIDLLRLSVVAATRRGIAPEDFVVHVTDGAIVPD